MTRSRFKFSIRARFFLLLFLLALLPFIAYRFAIDLHRLLLANQATIQQQTVENLALILENRTDLWALQIQKGVPNHLPHLNLQNSVIWIVNDQGQTSYVVGNLPKGKVDLPFSQDPFAFFGYLFIQSFAKIIPYSIPYPYPQSKTPENTLISQALHGKTYQQYRLDGRHRPITLMSATPLVLNDRIIGALVLEQRLDTLFGPTLLRFYHLIGLFTLVFVLILFGLILYTVSLSKRIIRLDADVSRIFQYGINKLQSFPDTQKEVDYDEISQLRHHIYQMLSQLENYEHYLKQLPKMLRHELHNPLNRLSMALSLLEKRYDPQQLLYAQRALDQLKKIINSLSEASSIEESLVQQAPEPYPLDEMLQAYFENLNETPLGPHLSVNCQLPHPTRVLGDGFMMEQLLDKLISNAMDFKAADSRIEIHCRIENGQVVITVVNQGPLIPQGKEKQIFDGMTSIRTVNQDEETHLGLGLYIARLIAEYHGGKIEAYNEKEGQQNIGRVVFKITLPIAE
ncbi:ATP-binding protein [Galenea microaerophila]